MVASGDAYFLQPLAAKYEKCAERLRCFFAAVGGVRPGFGGNARAQGPVTDEGKAFAHAARAFIHTRCASCEVEINKLTQDLHL